MKRSEINKALRGAGSHMPITPEQRKSAGHGYEEAWLGYHGLRHKMPYRLLCNEYPPVK